MDTTVDQQICLRWNNFQSNITAQFGTLRDDEDFVDVTIACEGRRLEAHKVVLSACSPFFKELFKSNPCPHPIIFMRDVEAKHIIALLEFMYAGEVQVAQAHLAGFLRTAESLQIRGLTDASKGQKTKNEIHQPNGYETHQQFPQSSEKHDDNSQLFNSNFPNSPETYKQTKSPGPSPSNHINTPRVETPPSIINEETQNSTQEFRKHTYSQNNHQSILTNPSSAKRVCKSKQSLEDVKSTTKYDNMTSSESPSPQSNNNNNNNQYIVHPTDLHSELDLASDLLEPKTEPDYPSDDEDRTRLDESILGFDDATDIGNAFSGAAGAMEIIPGTSMVDLSQDSNQALSDSRKLHSLDPRPCHLCGRVYSNLSNLRQHMRLIHHPQTVVCPYCGKQFKTTLYLKRHLVIYHNDTSDQRIPSTTISSSTSPPSSSSSLQHNDNNNQTNVMLSTNGGGIIDIKPDLQELNNTVVNTAISIDNGVTNCYQNDLIIKKFDMNDVQNSTTTGGDTFGFYGGETNMYSCQKENVSFQQL